MPTLLMIPTPREYDRFVAACTALDVTTRNTSLGRLPVVELPEQDAVIAMGGLGKVQYAVQMQHLLTVASSWDLAICLGAAGALDERLNIGDVVVATSTLEHDFRNGLGPRRLPAFPGAPATLDELEALAAGNWSFQVHLGPIASGDEDIVDAARRDELRSRTEALAVAWEGAGGARACQFSDVSFLEIRAITDVADHAAPSSFWENVQLAMENAAQLTVRWLTER